MGSTISDPRTGAISPLLRFSIQSELQRVLSSSSFQGSRRSQDFLACVVTRTLEGESEGIKERTLAVEVFGRNADRDLDHDSIVRVGAREVRKRLTQYYATEGANAAIRIDLPTGSYIPQFHVIQQAPPVPSATPAALGWRTAAVTLLVVLSAAALALRWRSIHPPPEPFDLFWQPLLQQRSPALIVVAHPIVYRPSRKALALDEDIGTDSGVPEQHSIEGLAGSDFVPVLDKYVGVGDSAAAFRMGELMASHGHASTLRLATRVDFADLRDSGAVLIGAFTNRWTMELTKQLRYRFALSGTNPGIVDSTNGRQWTLRYKTDDESSNEDYMILTRLAQSRTGRFLVVGAGLTQYGTGETGRILASPDALKAILAKLPAGWVNRNLQLVLHSEIVDGSPARPEVAAWWVW